METKTYIEVTVDNLFVTTNERQIVKSFFYRTKLNYTPREVAKELRLSRNQVNLLNTARLFKLSSESKDMVFKSNYLKASKRIDNVSWYNVSDSFAKHARKVSKRVMANHRLLIVKQGI